MTVGTLKFYKRFLQLLLLKICELFLFRKGQKLEVYFGMCESLLVLQKREDQISTACKK